jgi:hypothetical protein
MATQKQTVRFGLRLLTELRRLQPDLRWSGPEKTKHKYQYKIWLSSNPSSQLVWGYSTTTGDNFQMFKRARTALRRDLAEKLNIVIRSGDVFTIKLHRIAGAVPKPYQHVDIVWNEIFDAAFCDAFHMTYADANATRRAKRLQRAG